MSSNDLQMLEDVAVQLGFNFNKVADGFSFSLGDNQCPESWETQEQSVRAAMVLMTSPSMIEAMGPERAAKLWGVILKTAVSYVEMEDAGLI